MADVSGPFDDSPWSETEWYRHMPAAMKSGVVGSKVSGVANGALGFTASGRDVTLTVGTANVGGAGYSRTAPTTSVSVPANANSSLARRDRLVLRRSLSTRTVVPTIITGTASASPVAPAITQNATTFDLKMFSFLTPANSGTTLTSIVDERTWVQDGTATAVPGTHALLEGTSTQTITNNNPTLISLSVVSSFEDMQVTTGRITALSSGLYFVSGKVAYQAGTGRRTSTIYKNGASITQTAVSSSAGVGTWRVATAAYPMPLVAGDYIEIFGFQESGGDLDVVRGESFLQAHWMGPL